MVLSLGSSFTDIAAPPAPDSAGAVEALVDVAQSQHAVCVTDAETEWPGPLIRFANQACVDLLCCDERDLIGRPPLIFQSPLTDLRVLSRVRAALTSGSSVRAQTINRRFDGDLFRVRWTIDRTLGRDGCDRFVATLNDVTIEDRLRRRLLALDTLLAGLAVDSVTDEAIADTMVRSVAPFVAEIGAASVRWRSVDVDTARTERGPESSEHVVECRIPVGARGSVEVWLHPLARELFDRSGLDDLCARAAWLIQPTKTIGRSVGALGTAEAPLPVVVDDLHLVHDGLNDEQAPPGQGVRIGNGRRVETREPVGVGDVEDPM
jgi:hypothetical protein